MKTDSQLQIDVMEELRREPSVTATEIGVAVHDGTVALSSTVPTFAEKRAAEQAASRVSGVKAIAEEINVKPTGRHQRSDAEIAEMAARALEAHVWVPTDITVTVENGWVTVRGVVNWEFQIRAFGRNEYSATRQMPENKGYSSVLGKQHWIIRDDPCFSSQNQPLVPGGYRTESGCFQAKSHFFRTLLGRPWMRFVIWPE